MSEQTTEEEQRRAPIKAHVSDEQLATWEAKAADLEIAFPYGVRGAFTALLAEVRRYHGLLAESFDTIDQLEAKIEEQRKEIERLQMGIFREETGSENMVGKDQGT